VRLSSFHHSGKLKNQGAKNTASEFLPPFMIIATQLLIASR
jgi:hypothetical protein